MEVVLRSISVERIVKMAFSDSAGVTVAFKGTVRDSLKNADRVIRIEMEALVGTSAAPTDPWEMMKYLERDSQSQYPGTRIDVIKVVKDEEGGG